VKTLTLKIKQLLKFVVWVFNGYLGGTISLDIPQKTTVLITYFSPVRMKKINHQIRNILKCDFVERLIISNHNPDIDIHQKIHAQDPRLVVLNQPVKRGCGFRWFVASDFDPDYLIVIDDDLLLFSTQVADLFRHLLQDPEIPHGLAGMIHLPGNGFDYRDREDEPVDLLCEVYAITRDQLQKYMHINSQLSEDGNIARIVNATADFVVISQTGNAKPKIHDLGRLFRDETFQEEGIAVHKDLRFGKDVIQVYNAIQTNGAMEGKA
jgi:hypothetical protein